MSEEIPSDVMERARGLFNELLSPGVENCDLDVPSDIEAIARALMAERERAAREGYRVCAETRHVTLGRAVEAAILGSDHTAAMESASPGYEERRTLMTGETVYLGRVYSPGRRRKIKEGE